LSFSVHILCVHTIHIESTDSRIECTNSILAHTYVTVIKTKFSTQDLKEKSYAHTHAGNWFHSDVELGI